MDIVERLRKWKDSPLFNMADLDSSDMEEAADEIERLRQQNADLVEALQFYACDCKHPCGWGCSDVECGKTATAAIAKATGGE